MNSILTCKIQSSSQRNISHKCVLAAGPNVGYIHVHLFLFLILDIAYHVDDNSPFTCESTITFSVGKGCKNAKILLKWIENNGLKANPDKFHLLLSDKKL